jgi:hypothetical protein
MGRVDRSFTIRPGSPGFTLIDPGSVPQGSERVSEISRKRQRRDTERRHDEEPLRAETAVEPARADYQQCRWCADTDGSVDRQCRRFQVAPRHESPGFSARGGRSLPTPRWRKADSNRQSPL